MNIKRGFFRVWIVVAVAWMVGVGALFFKDVKSEFVQAHEDFSEYGILLLPVDCDGARGKAGEDYENGTFDNSTTRRFCWYKAPKYRQLYPEYKDMTDDEISQKLYPQAGLHVEAPVAPWTFLGKIVLLGLAGPAVLLLFGLIVGWVFVGFRTAET